MKCHSSRLISILMAGFVFTGVAQGQEERIALIDMDRVFNEFEKTKTADAKLKGQATEFNDERKELIEDYQLLEEGFKELREGSQNTALSDEIRAERRDDAEAKLVEMRELKSKIRRFDETRRKQLEGQSRRMRQDIVDDITDIVNGYARDEGFSMVMDASGKTLNGLPVLIYSDPKNDITDDVLEMLNQQE